jgi:hypothetical protein
MADGSVPLAAAGRYRLSVELQFWVGATHRLDKGNDFPFDDR